MNYLKTKVVKETVEVDKAVAYVIIENDKQIFLLDVDLAARFGINDEMSVSISSTTLLHSAEIIIDKKTKRVTKSRWF